MLTQPINPVIDSPVFSVAIYGAIAQLGERLTGSQEVVGSIPSSSTNKIKGLTHFGLTLFFFDVRLCVRIINDLLVDIHGSLLRATNIVKVNFRS